MNPPSLFRKESISPVPLASRRDWTIFTAMVLLVVGAAWLYLSWHGGDRGRIISIVAGAFAGMLPSVLMCLPVRGQVSSGSKAAFLARVAKMRFDLTDETDEIRTYTFRAPPWMRWDSNRITVQRSEDGGLRATVPYYVFRALKKSAASGQA